MKSNFNIAILIDGDNAQPKILKEMLEEVAKYGKATIRRIYGDWTTSQMKGWKDSLNQHSFNPIQKFAYTSGKNSTDSSLIIDAMDILHERNIDGFCIVSSDSDYTGLAKRIREQGVFVMGIGRKNTPIAFIQSCEIFTFVENIYPEEELVPDEPKTVKKPSRKVSQVQQPKVEKVPTKEESKNLMIDKAFDISVDEDELAYVSQIGTNLRRIDPSFDTRAFGFKNLTRLFESLPNYEVVRKDFNGKMHALIKRK
ncbi:NYN domain-containing protein [Flavobacterium sp.]